MKRYVRLAIDLVLVAVIVVGASKLTKMKEELDAERRWSEGVAGALRACESGKDQAR